jgi:hypothetical protein
MHQLILKINFMSTSVTIQDVRNVNNKVKNNLSTLGGAISSILTLDAKGLETQEAKIIQFLVKAKKDANTYKQLAEIVKPHYKSGNYNRYSILLGAKKLLSK